tara:strand:- start:4 stop:729 length:726 start_codon:yes stop_codon:yes gene_type:complete
MASNANVQLTNESLMSEERHQERTNNENIGFGTGAVIGAIVAGPIGAFVAGITGVFIAKHMNVNDEVVLLSQNLDKQKSNHQHEVDVYQTRLAEVKHQYQGELAVLLEQRQKMDSLSDKIQAENLLMSLQFSTGSSDISAHYQEQISAVAKVLNDSPMLKIDLSGYTDLEGEQELNKKLSLARVESVKQLLMAQGVNETQIAIFAFGEESPVVATNEQKISFYDRRVVLKLHNPLSQMVNR